MVRFPVLYSQTWFVLLARQYIRIHATVTFSDVCGDDPVDVAHIVGRKSGDIGQVSGSFQVL